MRVATAEPMRGTYAGLATKAAVQYLQRLGVTAIELMPVHSFLTDKHLSDKGLTNYWGYNTTNFFSLDSRYSGSGDRAGQLAEFKSMVSRKGASLCKPPRVEPVSASHLTGCKAQKAGFVTTARSHKSCHSKEKCQAGN